MSDEYLTKKEFENFRNNDFKHMCEEVIGIKADLKWNNKLTWALMVILLGRMALLFFGI